MRSRTIHSALLTLGLCFSTISVGTPSYAHEEPGLDAGILGTTHVFCDFGGPICRAEGHARISNNRPRGSGKVAICVGIEMHPSSHRNLSLEPLTVSGQAVALVGPGRSKTTTFKTVFNEASGLADHVHVVHAHKHAVHGGRMC